MLAACTQGPGGGGIGLASGQDPDPATVDFPIFYIRHQIPEDQDNVTRVRPFVEDDDYSATLWKRDRASPGAPETEITARLRVDPLGDPEDRYDIKDLAVAPDGLHVAFAMRGPIDDLDDEDEPPTWNIWEYNIATDTLHRVITSNIIEEEGQDVAPSYLPDGRILFSSTRQRQAKAILLDEGKAQFEAATEARNESAFVLHVMNADGTGIHQISFNPSSDLYGQVLQNGRVLFTRWDRAPGRDGLHLYTSNPDGTDTQLHYGAISHLTGTQVAGVNTPIEFMRAREMSDGRLMVLTRQRTDVDFGGNLTIIDANRFVENNQTLLASAGTPGPAQTPATLNDVRTIPGPSPGGRFNSGFPLWDGSGRILVSWTQCRLFDTVDPTRIVPCTADRLADPDVQTAPPLYSIWMFTPSQNTILPIMPPVEGVMVTEAVAAQPRTPLPAVIVDKQPPRDLDADLVAEGAGLLSIRSVYDIMGVDQARTTTGTATSIANVSNPTLAQYGNRLARFVRIEKPVSIPDDDDIADPDNSAFGPTGVMREIVAYAPVEPDGSVRMKVPANIAFQISVLDAERPPLQPRPSFLAAACVRVKCSSATAATCAMPRRRPPADGSRPQGPVQFRVRGRDRHRRGVPRHGEHHFSRSRRHHGARAFACGLLVHRRHHDDRTLRTAVDHAERQRGVRRDLEAGRAAHRFVRVRLSTVDDADRRPTSAASRSGRRPAASRFTTRPSARASATFIRCGRCRAPLAGVDTDPATVSSSHIRRPARTAIRASIRSTRPWCNCPPPRSSSPTKSRTKMHCNCARIATCCSQRPTSSNS